MKSPPDVSEVAHDYSPCRDRTLTGTSVEISTKPAKQVTFGEANDYGDHYEMYEDTVEASKRDYYSLDQVGESSTAATDTYQGEHTEYTPEVDILANAPKGPRLSAAIQPRIKDTRQKPSLTLPQFRWSNPRRC